MSATDSANLTSEATLSIAVAETSELMTFVFGSPRDIITEKKDEFLFLVSKYILTYKI